MPARSGRPDSAGCRRGHFLRATMRIISSNRSMHSWRPGRRIRTSAIFAWWRRGSRIHRARH